MMHNELHTVLAAAFLIVCATYLSAGLVFAVPFVLSGVGKIDAHAANGTWGFRFMLLPGAVFLWPLLARRWFGKIQNPPEEKNAHRIAARNSL